MVSKYAEALLRLFYPAECAICHAMLTLEETTLCGSCSRNLDALALPLEKALVEDRFESLDHAWSAFVYESPLKELLHGVKYAHRDYLLGACRRRVISLAQAVTSNHAYHAILPVPMYGFKIVERHFNQSEVLAKMLDPWVTPPIGTSLLIKKYPIPSQTSLHQHEREINVYGAFKVRDPRKVRGRSFLLVDDVFTTGSTANEAARILKTHGARRVDLFAMARTVTAEEKNSLRFIPPEAMILATQ